MPAPLRRKGLPGGVTAEWSRWERSLLHLHQGECNRQFDGVATRPLLGFVTAASTKSETTYRLGHVANDLSQQVPVGSGQKQ